MIPRLTKALSAVLSSILLSGAAVAFASSANPAAFVVKVSPAQSHPGEVAEITVFARIDPGWHLYSLTPVPPPGPSPTILSVSGPGLSVAGPATEDVPTTKFDPNFEKDVAYHSGHALFQIPVRVNSKKFGAIDATVSIEYETCNAVVCIPAKTIYIPAVVTETAGALRDQYKYPAKQRVPVEQIVLFLVAAFGAGLLSLATPCVFPLIPITFTSFIKQANGSRERLIQISAAYSLGIMALYLLVGALTTVVMGASGISRFATNPWVNLFAFAVFLVFALSFFETIRLELPVNLSSLQQTAKVQGGGLGLIALGVVFVLASFTCTAPFVGTLLVAAAGGSILRPLLGMFAFSAAFVSPFLLLSVFPGWVSRLPKSGVWLARVKATLGFVEIAASLKFLSNSDLIWQWHLLTQPVLLCLWAIIFLCAGAYLFGILRFGVVAETEPRGAKVPAVRALFGLGFVFTALYCFWGVSGRPLSPYVSAYLPPAGYGASGGAALPGVSWAGDYTTGLGLAAAQSKPLLIDFTGYTCTNCRLNERQVFPDPAVQSELAKFARVQLYTDGGPNARDNENLELTKFGDAALPLYGVIDASTGTVIAKTAGVQSVPGFLTFLRSAESTPANAAAGWTSYSDAALSSAELAGKPIVIDFTASWCTNCKAIERTVFTDPRVASRFAGFSLLRCDMTDFSSPANTAIESKYGIPSLPVIMFLTGSGKEVAGTRVTGLIATSDFLTKLNKASVL